MLGWGRIRTPLIPQMEAAECGAASLGILLAHFGRWVPIADLRLACGVNRDGASAASLVRAGARYGLRIRGWRKEVDSLSELQLPAILFWEFNHFLVLESIRGKRYHLNDPANGRRTVSRETFSEAFTGVVLTAERTPEFRPGGDPPNIWKDLWPWLKEARAGLLFVALAGLFLAIPGLALPVLLNLFVDEALGAGQRQWGLWMAAAVALSGVAVYLLTWLQHLMLRKIGIQLAVVNSQRILWRIFRLPTQFFNARFAGDLVSRVALVDQIADGASSQFVGLLVQLVISLLLLGLLTIYDPVIAGVVTLIAVANLLLVRWISRWRTDENRQLRREQALLFGTEEVGLRQIDSLRATAREDDFFVRWSGYQARELTARQHFVELGYVIGRLPGLFMLLGSMAVIGLGGLRVIEGDLTVGGLIAVYTLTGSFLAPLGRFARSVDAFQLLEADLQRVADIMGTEEDGLLETGGADDNGNVASLNGRLRLAGRLELRDVTFGYQPNGPPLIDGLSLTVAPGQRIAVVGPTGSGKSTLLSLVSGEHRPWSGEILFDGAPVNEIPRTVFTASVATVDQQIVLFDGTVRDNLTMWNSAADEQEIVLAAQDAHIHDEIISRVGGYDSHVQEGGRNFSGGQRQRLEIARALARRPSLLLLDEATSNLDAATEQQIDDALRKRGCSCLIVAHRLSTIRDCDQIIVLNRGREAQRGTHEELMDDPIGVYASWVVSQ